MTSEPNGLHENEIDPAQIAVEARAVLTSAWGQIGQVVSQQSRIIAALNAEVARLTLELEGRPPAPTANRATRRKTAKTAAKKTAAKPRK
jgi:hypothetical protein